MSLLIQETFVNLDRSATYGESDPYEPYISERAQLGKLYRSLRSEYGRCTSRVYLDTKSRGTIAVGWVFRKRMSYEDSRARETYLREVWVTVYETCDVTDPDHLEKKTRFGVEHVGFKHCVVGKAP